MEILSLAGRQGEGALGSVAKGCVNVPGAALSYARGYWRKSNVAELHQVLVAKLGKAYDEFYCGVSEEQAIDGKDGSTGGSAFS